MSTIVDASALKNLYKKLVLEQYKNAGEKSKEKGKGSRVEDLNKKKGHRKSLKKAQEKCLPKEKPAVNFQKGILIAPNPSSTTVISRIIDQVKQAEREKVLDKRLHMKNGVGTVKAEDKKAIENPALASASVPRVVEIGLVVMLELIQGSNESHPDLCMQALHALLHTLQGQNLESLKKEPPVVMEKLYSVLLQIAMRSINVSDGVDPVRHGLSNSISGLACSCLISLVLAWGRTGKMLSAMAAVLTSSTTGKNFMIEVPDILLKLQETTLGCMLGTSHLPALLQIGVLQQSHSAKFQCEGEWIHGRHTVSITCDGSFVYMLLSDGHIAKIGTGYDQTIQGKLYGTTKTPVSAASNSDSPSSSNVTDYRRSARLLHCKGFLYVFDQHSVVAWFDGNTFEKMGTSLLVSHESSDGIWFSDGQSIGLLQKSQEDNFDVHCFVVCGNALSATSQPLHINPVRTHVKALGDNSTKALMELSNTLDSNSASVVQVMCGKDFHLYLLDNGRVMFTGNQEALGIRRQLKQKKGRHPSFLEVPHALKIDKIAVAPNGDHAVLVSSSGEAFFVGTSRRGEDGIPSKIQAAPKPQKVRKMSCMDGKVVVNCACNVGTSAFVTSEGQLYMFGKDTTHAETKTGLVNALRNIKMKQVSMGKAHVVAVSSDGKLYTFGINNKGQCGRQDSSLSFAERIAEAKLEKDVSMPEEGKNLDENNLAGPPVAPICSPTQHKWAREECRICAVCQECTGYGPRCVNSRNLQRVPRLSCGCGAGDSGCAKCGCCRTCAQEADVKAVHKEQYAGHNIRVNGRACNGQQIQLYGPKRNDLFGGGGGGAMPASNEADVLKEASKTAMLPPSRVIVGDDKIKVSQVAAGAHHTVLVLENGSVYGFGLNNYGQLGLGDMSTRNQPCLIPVAERVTSVASGSYHTVLLSSTGRVYISGKAGCMGSHVFDQGREEMYTSPQLLDLPRVTWISACHDITFVKFGETLLEAKRFHHTHVLANEKHLVILKASEDDKVVGQSASSDASPRLSICTDDSPGTVIVDRKSGSCFNFIGSEQFQMKQTTLACLDPLHDILWSLDISEWSFESFALHGNGACFNKATELALPPLSPFSTQVAIPMKAGAKVLCSQAAANVLSCFDAILSTCPQGGTASLTNLIEPDDADLKGQTARLGFSKKLKEVYPVEDFSAVTRFKSNGGGWGYSAHSVEAIRFSCDTDVLLGGCGVYGGRGEYSVVIKVYEDGDTDEDADAERHLILQTCDIPYECGYREKFNVIFEQPIFITAGHFHTISAKITGPSSDCGSHGESQILTEDSVRFTFRRSKLSNNGTDVAAGQIPDLLYALPSSENPTSKVQEDALSETCTPVQVISEEFFSGVTQDGLKALLSLVDWAWESLTTKVDVCLLQQGSMGRDCPDACMEIDNLSFICICCLRLLCASIMRITKLPAEDSHDCTTEVMLCSDLVSRILIDPIVSLVNWDRSDDAGNEPVDCHAKLTASVSRILLQCQNLMYSCVDAFFPSPVLKWNRLNHVISLQNDESISASAVHRLLSVFFDALCQPGVDLVQCLPLFPRTLSNLHSVKSLISSPACADKTPSSGNGHGFDPKRIWQTSNEISVGSLQDMAQSVITIVVDSVHDTTEKIYNQRESECPNLKDPDILRHPRNILVTSACHFMVALMHELCFKATEVPDTAHLSSYTGNIDFLVASRFAQHVSNRCWNTGHGSPDAVCFSVTSSDVSVLGFGVYGGGGDHTYELEIMQQISGTGQSDKGRQNARWETLQLTNGVYKVSDCDEHNVAHIMFGNSVQLEENQVYAVRLRNHGERTFCGEQGSPTIQGPDGTEFRFLPCTHSSNGTSVIRGQIPRILYTRNLPEDEFLGSPNNDWMGTATTCAKSRATYEKQALAILGIVSDAMVNILTGMLQTKSQEMLEKSSSTESSSTGIKNNVLPDRELLLRRNVIKGVLDTPLASDLLPRLFEAIEMLVKRSPYCAVEVMSLSQQLLPPLASLVREVEGVPKTAFSENQQDRNHILVVESAHPYKSACVTKYVASFPEAVGCMVLEFSPKCQTAQSEDVLELFLPGANDGKSSTKARDVPVLEKMFQQRNWPKDAVILPGNSVVFSLTTASDYENVKGKKSKAFYGFCCTVTGFEMCSPDKRESRYKIMRQITSITGLSCLTLMRTGGGLSNDSFPPSLLVAPDKEHPSYHLQPTEEVAKVTLSQHPKLFHHGLSTQTAVTVSQALSGDLPLESESTEKKFLMDFVAASSNTSGGRLARWLQPDSYVDPTQCDLSLDQHTLKKDFATEITIVTKDQYGVTVSVPSLIIELTAKPIPLKDVASNEVCGESTYGSETERSEYPSLFEAVYEPTRHRDSTYHSISMMRTYRKYSFEELRYLFPRKNVLKNESMLVAMIEKGVYTATWIPMHATNYIIAVTFDHELKGPRKHVVVASAPDGMGSQLSGSCFHEDQNKTMKFVITNSSGLRIRSSPTLQSPQVGMLKHGDLIKTVEQLQNNDGLWVKLAKASMESFCVQSCQESWCLAFHNHYNKVLLVPSEDTEKCDHGPETDKHQDDHSPPTVTAKMPNDAGSSFSGNHQIQQTVFGSPSAQESEQNLVPGIFCVVKCGSAGHNVRCGPSFKAAPVGKLGPGDHANAVEVLTVGAEVWIRLDLFDHGKYCSDSGFCDESFLAWTLASTGAAKFLEPVSEVGVFSHCGKKDLEYPSFSDVKSKERQTPETPLLERSLQSSNTKGRVGEKAPSRGRPISVPKQKLANHDKVRAGSSSPTSYMNKYRTTMTSSKKIHPTHQLLRRLTGKEILESRTALPKNLAHARSFSADQLLSKRSQAFEQTHGTKPKEKRTAAKSFKTHKSDRDIESGGTNQHCIESESVDNLDEEGNITSPSPSDNSRADDVSTSDLRAPSLVHGLCSPVSSPATAKEESSAVHTVKDLPVKTAPDGLSPLVAECSRAVFVALLWHDGMVHDAMTCAGYIRFSHPVKPDIGCVDNHGLNAPARPQRRRANTISGETENEEFDDIVTFGISKARKRRSSSELSTTLTSLSTLWQNVSQAVVNLAVKNQAFSPCAVPSTNLNKDKRDVTSEHRDTMQDATQKRVKGKEREGHKINLAAPRIILANEGRSVPSNTDNGRTRVVKHPQHKDTKCELCGKYFPYPVTYHMKHTHKGCGMLASGFGYNSSGHYCGGWAGDCGDGGDGASTWYLLCMRCREKYVRSSQDGGSHQAAAEKQSFKLPNQINKESPLSSHRIIKENAMFLLELSEGTYSNGGLTRTSSALGAYKKVFPSPNMNQSCTFSAAQTFQDSEVLSEEEFSGNGTSFYETVNGHYQSETANSQHRLDDMQVWQQMFRSVGRSCFRSFSASEAPASRVARYKGLNNELSVGSKYGSESLKNSNRNEGDPTSLSSILQFVTQQHDLKFLRLYLCLSLRRAVLRVYALQALSWLLCSMVDEDGIHDVLWYFVNSLAPVEDPCLQSYSVSASGDPLNDDENFNIKLLEQEETPHCQHPVLDLQMAGAEVSQHITDSFHGFLLCVSRMLEKLPQNSIAQLLAIRCWSVHVLPSDHHFLHSSHVFSHISKILSKLEIRSASRPLHEDLRCGREEIKPVEISDSVSYVLVKDDITEFLDIQSSSHGAALGSLTDGSTETFWESADKDKTRVVTITVSAEKSEGKDLFIDSVHVHIDNSRDIGKKVSSLTFSMETSDETTKHLQSSDIDSYFAGWISCNIGLTSNYITAIKVQLKGCNEKVRARQLQVLGRQFESVTNADLLVQKPSEAILSQLCEKELLKAFRLLTTEIFGDLLKGSTPSKYVASIEYSSPAANDDMTMSTSNATSPQDIGDENLREHMVGILFSGNKLTRLQKQIFSHIVQAIAVESSRMKEDRENFLAEGHVPTPVADMYCFQLLSMVLALSGSDIGRHYVAKQKSLIYDLAFILHSGTPRIQRQVIYDCTKFLATGHAEGAPYAFWIRNQGFGIITEE